jgi:predicted porin
MNNILSLYAAPSRYLAVVCMGISVAAQAQTDSTVTLYGIVDAAVVYTTHQAGGNKTAIDSGQLATSRWGIKGTEDLGGGLKANVVLESSLAVDSGAGGSSFGTPLVASFFDRASTVGLSGSLGSINFGRQNMLGVDSIGLADPMGLAHAGTNPNVVYSALNVQTLAGQTIAGQYGVNNGGTELRQNNSIKYLTPRWSGFGGALMVGLGENAGNRSANSYTGASAYYTNGKSGAALAYAKLTDPTNASTMTLMGGGAKYAMAPVTFNLTYAQSENDATVNTTKRKIAITGLGLDYALSPSITLTGAYYNATLSGTADGKADQYVFLAKHAMSSRTTTYASVTLVKAGSAANPDISMASGLLVVGAGESDATRLACGIMHSF